MGTMTITYYEDDTINEKCGHNFKMITGNINIGTYATNGVAMDLSKQLPTKVHCVLVDGNGGYVGQYDYAAKKLKVYEAGADAAPLDEVGDEANLAAIDMRFVAVGK